MSEFHAALRQWWPVPDHEHPRLFFTALDREMLRAKIQALPEVWAGLAETAHRVAARRIPPEARLPHNLRGLLREAETIALIAWITGNPDLHAPARDRLWTVLEAEDWVVDVHKPLRVDLTVAGIAAGLATAYDWLFHALTPDEEQYVEQMLLERAIRPFVEIAATQGEWWTQCTHNWNSVICGEMGIAILVLCENFPQVQQGLELALKGVLTVLDHAGEDGSYPEGVGYWGYGIGEAARFAAALKRVTGVDLFTHPYLRVTGEWALDMYTPDDGCFNFEDCSNHRPNPWLMALLAREYQDPRYQWLAARKPQPSSVEYFLFYDPHLAPDPPILWPTAGYYPAIETVALRSGWEDKATYFGLHAGATTVNHAHLDVGTFLLVGRGQRLVTEPGVWPYDHPHGFFDPQERRWDWEANATLGHNTVLVDGQGQVYTEGAVGRIVHTEFRDPVDVVVCDLTPAYGGRLARFVRYAVFLKPDGVLLIDDLAVEGQSKFEWLLHYETGTQVTIEDTRWHLERGPAVLTGEWLGLDRAEGYVLTQAERTAHYTDWRDGSPQAPAHRYLSLASLHRIPEWLVATLLWVHDADAVRPPEATLTREGDKVQVEVTQGEQTWRVSVDLAARRAHV